MTAYEIFQMYHDRIMDQKSMMEAVSWIPYMHRLQVLEDIKQAMADGLISQQEGRQISVDFMFDRDLRR